MASSRWAARVGRNSMLVWKKVQVSQMDSNAQSSSGGAGAPAVAEHAVVLAAQPGHLRAGRVGGQHGVLAVEGLDLLGDGEVFIGDAIPLAPRTARAIDLATAERTDGPVFLTPDGRRLDRHGAGRIVRRVARQAGIGKAVTPHTLRRAFITSALDAGVPLRDVQEAASHADPRTTMRYENSRELHQAGEKPAGQQVTAVSE
jgi:Phage integrase family